MYLSAMWLVANNDLRKRVLRAWQMGETERGRLDTMQRGETAAVGTRRAIFDEA